MTQRFFYRQNVGSAGFTLVELAVVLVIVGMLISLGSGLIGPLTRQAKVRESKEYLNAGVESVVGWSASMNRLPDAGAAATGFNQIVKTRNDAWGKNFYYLFDTNLAPAVATKDTICGRRTTNLTLTIPSPVLPFPATQVISNVAFAVLSGGDDYNIQSRLTGTLNGAASANAVIPASGTATGTILATPVNATTAYDDLVKWITIDELRSKIGCSNPQLRLLTADIPAAKQGALYPPSGSLVNIQADGGVPFAAGGRYRWCIEAATAASVPGGITFNANAAPPPANAVPVRVAPATCAGLAEVNWRQADQLNMSGTPTTPGVYNFTVYSRDNNDPAGANDNITSKQYTYTVDSQFRILNGDIPPAAQGVAYTSTIVADGGAGAAAAYRWCVERTAIAGIPTFPPGLAFVPNTVRNTGLCTLNPNNWGAASAQLTLSGTPTVPGSYLFTAFVRDTAATNNIAQKQFTITVSGSPLRVVNNEVPSPGKVAVPYAVVANPVIITADGGVPFAGGNYRWCAQKIPAAPVAPPAGLTFTPNNLFNANCLARAENNWPQATQVTLYGTPNASGNFNFIIFVRDNKDPAAGTDNIVQKTLSFTVNP